MSEMKPTRDGYGHALLELGERRADVVVLDADLARSTRTEWFKDKYPQRFFNAGIAEQNLIGMASGLAISGLVPFATTYAIFISRALDQIRQAVCYGNTNVKIVATHGGLAAAYDGGSHQGLEDLALMRALPNMTVLCPADYNEARQAVLAAAEHEGPVYLRVQKEPVAVFTDPGRRFEIGRGQLLRDGEDLAVVAAGSLAYAGLQVADRLAASGISVRVVQLGTLKPIDANLVRDTARRCRAIVTIEEHNFVGGLYEAVLGVLGGRFATPVEPVAMPDCFGETGGWRELLKKYALDEHGILAAALRALTGSGLEHKVRAHSQDISAPNRG
jgi:transketolase